MPKRLDVSASWRLMSSGAELGATSAWAMKWMSPKADELRFVFEGAQGLLAAGGQLALLRLYTLQITSRSRVPLTRLSRQDRARSDQLGFLEQEAALQERAAFGEAEFEFPPPRLGQLAGHAFDEVRARY